MYYTPGRPLTNGEKRELHSEHSAAFECLIEQVKAFQEAEKYSDEHPDDPGWDVDEARESIEIAAKRLAIAVENLPPEDTRPVGWQDPKSWFNVGKGDK